MADKIHNTDRDISQELRELKEDLATLREDLGRTANTAFAQGRDAANQLAAKTSAEWQHGVDATRQTVQTYPLAATAAAVGVGAILGILLTRR